MGIGRAEAERLLPKDWRAFSGALNELCLASFMRDNFGEAKGDASLSHGFIQRLGLGHSTSVSRQGVVERVARMTPII